MPYSIMLDAGHGGYPLRKYTTKGLGLQIISYWRTVKN